MGFHQLSLFIHLLLVITSSSIFPEQGFVRARPLALPPHHPSYSKFYETLGVVCKCCDGVGAECSSRWTGSCSKLQCLPWKFH
ncbi:hypothetical protein Nepgr_012026 [Nepenthes gracilis]|uniref:Uncharacterized protein n=1 Tax=Nepenthes gracilis TaxID=150966 RepID=A0AAD3XMY9_NEPGR|nr:hypothetical protein Nepgr_012026 [Nepenthes gracilis]